MRSLIVVIVLVAACDSKAPRQRKAKIVVPAGSPGVAMSSSSTTNEEVPPAPVTVDELVEGGRHWRLATVNGGVHVWIPRGYNFKRADAVVYVHGYYTNVDQAWNDHGLEAQFAVSTINAMFIACEAPTGPAQPVRWQSIAALLDTVERGIGQPPPRRRIVAIGHSGAYRTILDWLDEPLLDTVVLLDAAYGEIEAYRTWVLAANKNRLIDVGDNTTKKWTEQLHALLPETLILDGFPSVEDEIPRSARQAKIVYIRSNLGHLPLVTGGIALPMVLRTLRAKRLLDVPLADLLETAND